MPLYWVASYGTSVGRAMSTQSQMLLGAALSAAGWVVAGVAAWWYGDDQPNYAETGWIVYEPCGGSVLESGT
jgi:hypothetical protein